MDGGLLESDVGVGNDSGAQNGIHDGIEGASGERSEAERDEANADGSVGG